MAGGKIYCDATISVDGSAITDVTEYGFLMGATLLYNESFGHKYKHAGCSVNHIAELSFKTYDLSVVKQSSSASPFIGSKTTTSGVVLTANEVGGTTVVCTIDPARVASASINGSHGSSGMADVSYEAIGVGGIEPTVTVATGS